MKLGASNQFLVSSIRLCSPEHRPCMPVQILGRWAPVSTIWNYRKNQSPVLVRRLEPDRPIVVVEGHR